jgi:hypothetical protein
MDDSFAEIPLLSPNYSRARREIVTLKTIELETCALNACSSPREKIS